uniref:Uncharacterized protein n=1 Tax=Picea sitchensis TaxID=3332 RepID=A0A6B9XXF3_PICSI|nr:hypothetical protein Q903MT_gene6751 [Picea sitchensis]
MGNRLTWHSSPSPTELHKHLLAETAGSQAFTTAELPTVVVNFHPAAQELLKVLSLGQAPTTHEVFSLGAQGKQDVFLSGWTIVNH